MSKSPPTLSELQHQIDTDPNFRSHVMRAALEASLNEFKCMYCGSGHCLHSTPQEEKDFSWLVTFKCLSCGQVFHIRTGGLTLTTLGEVKEVRNVVTSGKTRIGGPPPVSSPRMNGRSRP
jgi:ribosomal protein S27E